MDSFNDTHEREAWEAYNQALRRVEYQEPGSGKLWQLKEWQARHAPSPGARALAILRGLLFPPSYISACELALAQFLSDEQRADRRGLQTARKSNAPQKFTGVQQWG